jgi:arabinogalactan endo-1,4-beta-galactosidase
MYLLLIHAAAWLPSALAEDPPAPKKAFLTGVDANYSLDLAERGVRWKVAGQQADLFQAFRQAGSDSCRVRVWTGDEGPSGKHYAGAVAKRAQAAGLKPYLVFFLSENWADYVKQPAPAAWKGLAFAEKRAKVSAYSENTARYFRELGVDAEIFEIGNEIDFGICGEFEEAWERRFDYEHMRKHIWNKAAEVIRAAQQGIQRAAPQAKFILHLTQWWNPEFCNVFLDTMRQHEVQVDYVGLTFFPSAGLSEKNTFSALGQSVEQIFENARRPVILCEYAYPSRPQFGGQFATWNKEVAGYPISPAGQKKWIADLLAFCRGQQHIHGAYYWSPEWYPEEMWKAFALFGEDGNALEGFNAFQPGAK